jgi:hypothetical protein
MRLWPRTTSQARRQLAKQSTRASVARCVVHLTLVDLCELLGPVDRGR